MMKKAIIYGAGNIGRGFLGQLLSQSGYEVVFIEVNLELVNALNKERAYPIRFTSDEGNEDMIITDVRAVNGLDIDQVAKEISTADLMATAVGINILPLIAENIAAGLKLRWHRFGYKPLDIIICENMIDSNHYLKSLIMAYVKGEEWESLEKYVGFVEASIGRMVPVSTIEAQEGDPLRVCVEAYDQLPVDRDGFRGDLPLIKQMIPYSPFSFYIQRKLYIHNLGHAITAYLGHLYHYHYIWEAIEDPRIKKIVRQAMLESANALVLEHRADINDLECHVDDLIRRFGNHQLGDTVERVGRDPLRKLSPQDRLIGALLLCKKHNVMTPHIKIGIVAAIKYMENSRDNVATDIEAPKNEMVLQHICGLSPQSSEYKEILELLWMDHL